jgi:hypothetical protein
MHSTISGSPPRLPAATLDEWALHDWRQGVLIPRLAPHDRLVVRTRNSTYEIIVTVPHTASVLVRGGAFFPCFTAARLAGSSMGGGLLKLHGVYAGFQMELLTEGPPIITTRVHSVSVLPVLGGTVM